MPSGSTNGSVLFLDVVEAKGNISVRKLGMVLVGSGSPGNGSDK